VIRAGRMPLVFWFYTLVFALAVVLPAGAILYSELGHSLYAERMLENFDLQWLTEMLNETGGLPLDVFPPLIALVAAGYVLLSTFLAGGALTVFASEEGSYRPGLFYEGCGRNFGRLFRLLLVSAVFYGVVLAVSVALKALGKSIWGEGMEERPLVIFGWFRTGLTVLLLLVVNMIFDYAKIRLVVEDSRKSWRAALGSVKLVFRNLGGTAATYGLVALLAVALALAYAAVCGFIPRNLALGMALLLVMQQAFVLSRIGVKLLFFGSQLEIYRGVTAAPALAEEPPPPEVPAGSESGPGALEVGVEAEDLV
jgi:hypothetical protein